MLETNNDLPENYRKIYDFIITYVDIQYSEELSKDITLIDLKIDSLTLVDLQMQLEDNFSLTFSLENLSSDTSLKSLILNLQPIDG
jgi:acyl carrier protein